MNIKKCGTISIIGRPNVGKSTLLNALLNQKVAIVSQKPQTTRTRITGVLNKDDCQFIFLDTPGLHKPQSRLGDYMVQTIYETATEVDVALLVIEPEAYVGTPEKILLERLRQANVPTILLINKVDKLKKEELLKVISVYSKAYDFAHILPISARENDGLSLLLSLIEPMLPDGEALFPLDMITDQSEKTLICEFVREKLLLLLEKEIPHGIGVEIERYFELPSSVLEIDVVIYCEKESHKGIIIGKNGNILKSVGEKARADIEKLLKTRVLLKLWVKVKEDWRNNEYQMRGLGYLE
jgi:GTP-binding protein Era